MLRQERLVRLLGLLCLVLAPGLAAESGWPLKVQYSDGSSQDVRWQGRAGDVRLRTLRPPAEGDRSSFQWIVGGVRLFGGERPALRSLEIPIYEIDSIRFERRAAEITLRSGETLRATGGELERERGWTVWSDGEQQTVSLSDVAAIEFGEAPPLADALFGEVRAHSGQRYRGRLRWDADELARSDTLDGTERSVRFEEVATVTPLDARCCDVTLRSGESLRLCDTNDVGEAHRGMQIWTEDGRVDLSWASVATVQFEEVATAAPTPLTAADERIRGLVCAKDGRQLAGLIEWDLDERYRWETLEGRNGVGDEFHIPFSRIAEIASEDGRSSWVRLTSGRELLLFDRNDVASDHRGVRVDDGEPLTWYEVERSYFVADEKALGELLQRAPCSPGERDGAGEHEDGQPEPHQVVVGTHESPADERRKDNQHAE